MKGKHSLGCCALLFGSKMASLTLVPSFSQSVRENGASNPGQERLLPPTARNIDWCGVEPEQAG